jgi:polysaccharide deacetylase family protein (PEP-CTERM system associated)
MNNKQTHILTIDVEEWFHVGFLESLINKSQWPSKESRIRNMIDTTLCILDDHKVKATFFFVGWLAQHHQDIVKQVHNNGHEVASHGYWHRECDKITNLEFKEDIILAKKILEDTISNKIYGFRAPAYSITKDKEWAIDEIVQAGYCYDSSLLYGNNEPYEVRPGLLEIAPNSICFNGKWLPMGGGFVFRTLPYSWYKLYINYLQNKGCRLNFYIHSWELYVDYPRIDLDFAKKFVQYYNLKDTKEKFVKLLNDYKFASIENLYFK